MEFTSDTVQSKQIGHLGLLAAVIGELGIIEKIDLRIKFNEKKGSIVSHGRRVAAMLINGLGFMNSRLYMTSHFFQDKPIGQLLDAEITAEHLNDDSLGRCLDKIADYGVTQLYSELAFEIASEKKLLSRRLHLDNTSLTLQGRYETSEDENPKPAYGYSKAHRPDLKQVMLSLVQGGEANLPLWMEALDGNTSDKTSFHETVTKIKKFMATLKDAPNDCCFVVDAAFYDSEKLAELDNVKWITRIPATLKEAKTWLQTHDVENEWQTIDENYRSISKQIIINGLMQRWVMLFSQHAYQREIQTLQRKMQKHYEELQKELWHLSNQVFNCVEDAEGDIKNILKKLKYHQVNYEIVPLEKHQGRGRPSALKEKIIKGYCIQYSIASDIEKVSHHQQTLGRFILATNQLESDELSHVDILKQYKEQSQVESGFKFIKSDTFELDSVFLKTPRRIGALMMIMTLCLMVYNFAQYHLRRCLKENNDVLPNQQGKPVKNPTMKWIAELMNMIAVVTIHTTEINQKIVTNVNQVHRKIIAYFGKSALKIYGLPTDYQQVAIDFANYKNLIQWCEM